MSEKKAPLYLSRLILDLNCRQVKSEIAQPYEMHRTLMHAFEKYVGNKEKNARAKCGVLFRADVDELNGHAVVYVQSIVKPDWSFLVKYENYLLSEPDIPNPVYKDVMASYRKLRTGQILAFSLRANPTKRIGKPLKGNAELKGKRIALLREEEHINWLIRKGNERENGCPGGFNILAKEIREQDNEIGKIVHVDSAIEGKQIGYKTDDEGRKHRMTHLAVRFNGLLSITDPDAFRTTLARGIGPAKAYGFGLMLVKRARSMI